MLGGTVERASSDPDRSALTFADCFSFPLRSVEGRRDVLVGALWLLTTLPGWVLNLGHRLEVVHRLYRDEQPPFRGFGPVLFTLQRGLTAWFAIALYLSPAALLATAAWLLWPGGAGLMCASAAVISFGLAI